MSAIEIVLKVIALPVGVGALIAFVVFPFIASARSKRIEDIVRKSEKGITDQEQMQEMYERDFPIIHPN